MTRPRATAAPAPIPAASARSVLVAGALIVLAALAAYHNSFSGPFVFDDKDAITDNASLRHLASAWFPPGDMTASGRPVLNFSLGLSYALSRKAVWGYHAVNVLIHLLAGLTLFGLVRRTLARARNLDATPIAFVIALLWTVHPLQTESVTYVIQRAESLMGLFYLLTIYCFVRSAEGESAFARSERASADKKAGLSGWAVLSILACFFGMATKEAMVSAPLIVLLYDRTFLAGTFRDAWRRRWPLHLGLFASWVPLFWLLASTGFNRGGSIGFGVGVTWWAYGLTQFKAIATYLGLSFWPSPLIFDHGTFWVHRAGEVVPDAVLVVALVLATGWGLLRCPADHGGVRLRPLGFGGQALGFAGAWFFLILAPTSLAPGTTQMIVEHRMYLSLAAVVTAVVIAVHSSAGRRGLAVLGLLALPLAFLTARRNEVYRSERSLWADTVAKQPGNSRAETSLGTALLAEGDTAGALAQIQAALRLEPDSFLAHTDLGNALQKIGQNDAALAQYQEALRLKPDYVPARIDLGSLLYQLDRLPESIAQTETVVRLKPDDAEAQINLGMALTRIGRAPEAIDHFESAVRLNPDLAPARFNLGNALRVLGRIPEAISEYEQALQLAHPYPEASMNLGNLLLQQGRTAEAVARFKETLQARPDFAEAHNSLGVALGRSGHLPEAVDEYRSALRINPHYGQAQSNLAQALGQMDRLNHESPR